MLRDACDSNASWPSRSLAASTGIADNFNIRHLRRYLGNTSQWRGG